MVACVFIINSQHEFCELVSSNNTIKSTILDYTIKTIRLDNAGEFISQELNDYCVSTGITLEHSISHVHTHNSIAESFIKRLQ